ncbi:MAG: DUF1295 domain-containing protein [Pseudomonadota bacterium]
MTDNAATATPPEEPVWRTAPWGPLVICGVAYGLALIAAWGVIVAWPGGGPLWGALAADVAATVVVFAVSTVVRNSSVYDPYWSVAPPVLFAYWMSHPYAADGDEMRNAIVLVLVVFWAARLTFNCFRRWRDMRGEDFRYIDLRKKSGKLYPLMDLFGIQLFPTALVFLAMLPLYPVAASAAPFGAIDFVAALVTLAAINIEMTADQQLVRFQKTNTDPEKVCDVGLWRWSQHPNYFGEVLFWWGLWLFVLAAAPSWWWTVVGPLAMTALFVFVSIPWMIRRKRSRRPSYDAQVKGRSVFVLWPPKS